VRGASDDEKDFVRQAWIGRVLTSLSSEVAQHSSLFFYGVNDGADDGTDDDS